MIPGSYEQVIERISKSSGLGREEIERKIEARKAKLSGLVSKEGAAQIVASELGISFEREKMKLSELLSGMKKINVTGKIVKIYRVIEYEKENRRGKIGSFLLADETSNMRIVLWDVNHIALLERSELKEGDVVEISGGDIRNNEMHLSGLSDIKKSIVTLGEVREKPVVFPKNISEIALNDNVSVRAFVVQIYGPTIFYSCPECNKRLAEVNKCQQHGNVIGLKKAILNFVLDDGTGVIRATLFDEQVRKIVSAEELANADSFMAKRSEFLGKEFIIEGNARKNRLYENTELIVNDLSGVEIEALIRELEGKIQNR